MMTRQEGLKTKWENWQISSNWVLGNRDTVYQISADSSQKWGKFAHSTETTETRKSVFGSPRHRFLDFGGFKPKWQIRPRDSRHQNQLWQFGVA